MKTIDYSNMPEGATHKNQSTGRWYRHESGEGAYSKGWYRSSGGGNLWVKMQMDKAAQANLVALPPFAAMNAIDQWEQEGASKPTEAAYGMSPLKIEGGSYVPFPEKPKALDVQVGGQHYKDYAIQPVEFIHKNHIGFCEGNAIKYLCRWREKGGLQDLKKARHYIDLLIEMENNYEQRR
jgi:hypothetical protein